jgi:hypothetical protein
MYIHEAIQPLVATLEAATDARSEVLVAHGRNRQAEPAFLRAAAAAAFEAADVAGAELDPVYQCSDVQVLRLRRRC